MQISHFRCKTCNRQLFLTNSAYYRCDVCKKDFTSAQVDPKDTDAYRLWLLREMAWERGDYERSSASTIR